jgi:hypothetical protein
MEGVSALLGKADIGGLFQLISEICEQLGTGGQHSQCWSATLSWAFSIEVELFLYEPGPPVRKKDAPEI